MSLATGLLLGWCGSLPAQAPIAQVVFLPQEQLVKPPEKAPDKKGPDKKEPIKKEPVKQLPEVVIAEEVKPGEPECKDTSIFAKMPPIARFPRPGNPAIAPPAVPEMGCGFYSLKDCVCGEVLENPPKYP